MTILIGIMLALILFSLVCISFAERNGPVEDDQFTPEQPFPGPSIEYGSTNDRLAARDREWEGV